MGLKFSQTSQIHKIRATHDHADGAGAVVLWQRHVRPRRRDDALCRLGVAPLPQLVDVRPSSIHHDARMHIKRAPGLLVGDLGANHAAAVVFDEVGGLCVVCDRRAGGGGGAGERHVEARVVKLAVVVADLRVLRVC